jgi:Zn-dependent peptidase ImmA (M78 family)
MGRGVQVSVKPDVLKWARVTSGATVEDAAERVRVPPAAFAKWETEEAALTLTQLRELSNYFKRPLAAFLLTEPPEEPAPPRDYRTLPRNKTGFERETRLAIRKALRLRSIAKELMQSLQQGIAPGFEGANLLSGPEQVAQRERERIGVSVEEQEKWRHEWEAYRKWRAEIERQNVLVFQFPMPVEDARGFSLGDDVPNAIAVNSSDAIRAKNFTLFHEYAHLLLHTAGVCTPRLDIGKEKQEAEIERWCNRFAGAFLVPPPALQSVLRDVRTELEGQVLFDALKEGARNFKVSEQVVLRRLLDLELLSKKSFNFTLGQLVAGAEKGKPKGGIVRPAKRCLAENGVVFTSIVLEARSRGLITYSDVGDFLNVRLKYLPEIESSLATRAA